MDTFYRVVLIGNELIEFLGLKTLVLSDSLSELQAFKKSNLNSKTDKTILDIKSLVVNLHLSRKKISLCWSLEHSSILGKTAVDLLVKEGAGLAKVTKHMPYGLLHIYNQRSKNNLATKLGPCTIF